MAETKTLAQIVTDTLAEKFPERETSKVQIDREAVVHGVPSIRVTGTIDGREFEATFDKDNHMTPWEIGVVLASHVRRSLT